LLAQAEAEAEAEKYLSDSDEIRLSEFLFSEIRKNDPKFKQPDFQKWAVHINRLIKIDKRSAAEIESVIIWCQNDSFWQSNILSASKLRKQFAQLLLKKQSEINRNQQTKPIWQRNQEEMADAGEDCT
jgi:hypothetical protein